MNKYTRHQIAEMMMLIPFLLLAVGFAFVPLIMAWKNGFGPVVTAIYIYGGILI